MDNKSNDEVHACFGHFGKWQLNLSSMRLTKKHLKIHIELPLKDIVKTEKVWDLI